MKVSTESLRQLVEEVRARGGEVRGAVLPGDWGAEFVELEDSCGQQLTQTCRALGIDVPEALIQRPPRARYYRGCRG